MRYLSKKVPVIFAIVGAIVVLSFVVWYEFYRFSDCTKVGHSTFYCIMNIGG